MKNTSQQYLNSEAHGYLMEAHMSHIEGLQSCFYLFAQGKGEGFDLVNILTMKGSI